MRKKIILIVLLLLAILCTNSTITAHEIAGIEYSIDTLGENPVITVIVDNESYAFEGPEDARLLRRLLCPFYLRRTLLELTSAVKEGITYTENGWQLIEIGDP
uniref:Uncharacterized protein n=1 Tax=Candidatus Methanophaga sp. ANME-1 ERB7 TaxID=2759913 RepID=A0A7G9Z469_9EURY|nr:hypothetical protein FPOEFMDM_00038 [Methanosarcinales archaeon ANME-1 ERB7]QNO55125.1 hypothetical protein MNNOGLJF_00039 [Methanosarcinales archaeon ANME-1 ERB7]